MSRALVTGGAGFLGSHVADALLARGDDLRIRDVLHPAAHAAPDHLIDAWRAANVALARCRGE